MNKQAAIKYPCEWTYKVFGQDVDQIIQDIEYVVSEFQYQIMSSNISKSGKYVSLNLLVYVYSEIDRNKIFQKLNSSKSIKYVL